MSNNSNPDETPCSQLRIWIPTVCKGNHEIACKRPVTNIRVEKPQSPVDRVQRCSPCKYQGGGDSIVSYMSSSAADLDYASDDSIADIPDISDEDISDIVASEPLNDCNTGSLDTPEDMTELRAKMVAIFNRLESRKDQETQYNAEPISPIGQDGLTTEKHVRFARSPQLITSPEASCTSPNFLNDIAYSTAYKQDVCDDDSNFYDVRNMVTERQEELRAKLRELNERTANRMRATTPTVLGNLLLNRTQTPCPPSPIVQDMQVPNESTFSDSESDSSQWNTRYFYADDTQVQSKTACVTHQGITSTQVARPQVIGETVKCQDECKATFAKSMHTEHKDEAGPKSDEFMPLSQGNTGNTHVTAKKKSDVQSKPEKKKKSGKKGAKSTTHPRLPTYPRNSYIPNTRLVLPPIGCADNWIRSPCKTPEGFLPEIDEFKQDCGGKVDQKKQRKRSRMSKTEANKTSSVYEKNSKTKTKNVPCDPDKTTKARDAPDNKTITSSNDKINKTCTASGDKVSKTITSSNDKINKTITASSDKVNKSSTASGDKVNKSSTASGDKINKTSTVAGDKVTKTITASDDSGLGQPTGLDNDATFIRKAILQVNNNTKTYGQQFVPLENTMLHGPVNPALKTFATHSWRVLKFRAQFNRESVLLPPIGNVATHDLIERHPGKIKLGCHDINSKSDIDDHLRQVGAEIKNTVDTVKVKQFPIEAITPSAPSGKKPKVHRPSVKVKLPSAEEQENIKQLIQQGNHLPMPPRTDKPHNRIKRSRATVRVPCVDTEEEDDMNGFIKYF